MDLYTGNRNSPHVPVFTTPEKYIKAKLKILERDFLIRPTVKELEHVMSLETEYEIDTAIRKIIIDHLDKLEEVERMMDNYEKNKRDRR